jgi:hypothetical protein
MRKMSNDPQTERKSFVRQRPSTRCRDRAIFCKISFPNGQGSCEKSGLTTPKQQCSQNLKTSF